MSSRPALAENVVTPVRTRTSSRWSRHGRGLGAVTAAALGLGGLALATPAEAAPASVAASVPAAAPAAVGRPVVDAGEEAQFVALLNKRRRSVGVRAVVVHSDLVDVARGWSASMARTDQLAHNPRLGGQVHTWRIVGENVGLGYSVASLDDAFWASPGHRYNLLDRQFTEVGVGVVTLGQKIWVTLDFRALWPAAGPVKPVGPPAAKARAAAKAKAVAAAKARAVAKARVRARAVAKARARARARARAHHRWVGLDRATER